MSRAATRPEQDSLFADDIPEAPSAPRRNDRPEAAALAEVLQALRHHPLVAWANRQNSGVARMGKLNGIFESQSSSVSPKIIIISGDLSFFVKLSNSEFALKLSKVTDHILNHTKN